MTSLYRSAQAAQGGKNATTPFGIRGLNVRQRNYSNSRLQTYQVGEWELGKQLNDTKKRNELTSSTNHSKELKKYCLSKFKQQPVQQKFTAIRKNRSLKVMAQHPSTKQFTRPKIEQTSCQELFMQKKDENHSQSGKLISIKRRVQLIRNHQNKRKLTIKDKETPSDAPHSDVSLAERLDFCPPPQLQKVQILQKPHTENVLGQGLKKCSSSKRKILVKNPFERLMRLQQSRQGKKPASPLQTSIEELHESHILQKMQRTVSNFSNRCELQEMLALI